MAAPRAILGCAGGRIRVILGETGSDYLYYLDEDNGDSEWQSWAWYEHKNCCGPPSALCRQIDNMVAKGRHITSVDFDSSGQWFVAGQKRDGSGYYAWWGGTDASDEIKKSIDTSKVYFGDEDEDGNPIWIVLNGRNGYQSMGIAYSNLLKRIERMNKRNKSIDFIRCFNVHGYGPGYFMCDDEGTEWESVGTELSKELKNGHGGDILDVALARDGSWIVVREHSFVASNGVASALTNKLNQFYVDHRHRQASRRNQINAYNQQQEERLAEIRRKMAERLQEEARAEEKARLEAAQKAKAEAEREALKRQCDDADNLRQIQAKRLKPMERVTAIGFSSEPGDAIVKKIEHGSVEVVKPLHPEEQSFIIKDPRLLTQFHTEQDTTSLTLLCYATDKYEAAISMYYCACYDGMCHCTMVASAKFLPGSIMSSAEQRLLTHPPPRPVIENGSGSLSMPFDEYKCPEKIDMRRLKEIAADLESDSDIRASWLEKINRNEINCSPSDLKILQRCHALEEIVKALVSRLSPLPMDNNGCVVYEVNYEHRDNAGRGRLFAIGENVKLSDSKYPRTATLQGMQSDLRAALAGKFAHDIDCANSEVRLICSIAKQLGMKDLIPTIFDYRDRRVHWLRYIEEVHKTSESDAKRLVNIILSGGRYETWLKSVGMSASFSAPADMKKFYFKLYSEINALRDQLLQHPKFKWTEVEREKLKKEGRPSGSTDSALMPRIVQSCENEVLGIIHRIFTQHNWTVRAKVFDGLVVEPGRGISLTLEEVNKEAENVCRSFGWDIQLVEKPLHGEVATPVTIEKARAIIRQLSGRSSSTRTMGTVRVIRRQW